MFFYEHGALHPFYSLFNRGEVTPPTEMRGFPLSSALSYSRMTPKFLPSKQEIGVLRAQLLGF